MASAKAVDQMGTHFHHLNGPLFAVQFAINAEFPFAIIGLFYTGRCGGVIIYFARRRPNNMLTIITSLLAQSFHVSIRYIFATGAYRDRRT